eukprot:c11685_g1_i2.p2 GENE.c11685_g1_i2~~c11685_g1_i2.p2  ORF type:complete len:148 (+),score=25.09 c11685_g1_i2:40-444(+)
MWEDTDVTEISEAIHKGEKRLERVSQLTKDFDNILAGNPCENVPPELEPLNNFFLTNPRSPLKQLQALKEIAILYQNAARREELRRANTVANPKRRIERKNVWMLVFCFVCLELLVSLYRVLMPLVQDLPHATP